jgi:hypothetical protein
MGSFNTAAYCTVAGNGGIWILDGVIIGREVKHRE